MSDFLATKETREGLEAMIGSGKLSKSLERLLLSAHHYVCAVGELETGYKELQERWKKREREKQNE